MFPIFFSGSTDPAEGAKPPLMLFNTLTRKKERFSPVRDDYVRMYNCGPTVYSYIHIGNLRAFVFADILRRTFLLNSYKVMQVMNITDVGHLVSDGDDGDDKMTLALKREGKALTLESMYELATFYKDSFIEDLDALNIKRPTVLPRASEHIAGDIAMVETLIEKQYAYRTSDGVYFDTARFSEYGKLGGIDTGGQRSGARVEVNHEKRNPIDFALWKRDENLGWESPWGRGFPGWHLECSAMALEYLGKEIDVHTGGIDLIGTHHNNEIAQSECATGKRFARYWMHNEFINIEGTKISKSLKNTISLKQLIEHGYNPLAYRYWLLTGHYRTKMNFSFTALDGSATALTRLHRFFVEKLRGAKGGVVDAQYGLQLLEALNDDLDTPKALSLIWKIVKDTTLNLKDKRVTLLHFDKALGLGLITLAKNEKVSVQLSVKTVSVDSLPEDIQEIIEEREKAREEKDWSLADELREKIASRGYAIEDSSEGPIVTPH
ncbi:MAG: Cysteine-tRNA ligase [Parcubacteria group bacterium GW2011_GWA2_43_11]|nr:MAG: Cysteine-tRNA ligase [Parcubacteria group bacterium GW2011_GWA2_43_11]